MTIEPDGSVSAVELSEALDAPFRDAYVAAIRRWRFEPVARDGVAVRAIGHMSLGLYLETEGEERMRAGFERVTFVDPPPPDDRSAPRIRLRSTYPVALARAGIGGEVEVVVERDDEGRVVRAAPRRGALYTADPTPTPAIRRAMSQLAEAAVDAARRLPNPAAAGQRLVVVPVSFTAGAQIRAFWKPVLEVPVEAPAWVLAADEARWVTAAGEAPSASIRPLQAIDGSEVLSTNASSAGG